MNWGKGIVIGLVAFVTFITAMGVYMFGRPDDYDQQYYDKGLAFDKDYNREKQVYTDHLQPQIKVSAAAILVNFVQPANGTVNLIRPADRKLDRTINLQSNNENQFYIPTADLAKGPWQLVFEWANNGKKYLYQQEVFVP